MHLPYRHCLIPIRPKEARQHGLVLWQRYTISPHVMVMGISSSEDCGAGRHTERGGDIRPLKCHASLQKGVYVWCVNVLVTIRMDIGKPMLVGSDEQNVWTMRLHGDSKPPFNATGTLWRQTSTSIYLLKSYANEFLGAQGPSVSDETLMSFCNNSTFTWV